MTTGVRSETTWKRLCHEDDVTGVVVETNEEDRFVLSLQDAIQACRSIEKANEYLSQLSGVFRRLTTWLNERPEKIDRAYLSLSGDGLDFTIVQRSNRFDPEIDEPLVDLDISIAKSEEFNLITLDVMSLPYCDEDNVLSFVKPRLTWVRRMPR